MYTVNTEKLLIRTFPFSSLDKSDTDHRFMRVDQIIAYLSYYYLLVEVSTSRQRILLSSQSVAFQQRLLSGTHYIPPPTPSPLVCIPHAHRAPGTHCCITFLQSLDVLTKPAVSALIQFITNSGRVGSGNKVWPGRWQSVRESSSSFQIPVDTLKTGDEEAVLGATEKKAWDQLIWTH